MKSIKTVKPVKRHLALQPLSREHHHALLLSWKIRAGLKNKAGINRIKKYSDVFFKNQLLPHFEIEEKHLFPILGKHHDLVRQAVEQHRELKQLFIEQTASVENLSQIADKLDQHIRFEERILFNAIQKAANTEDLKKLANLHPEQTPVCQLVDEWEDKFWVYPN